jgi:cytochrome P450
MQPPATPPNASSPDLYEQYEHLRDGGAVHLMREQTGLERYTVVSYDASRDLLVDDRISKDPRRAWDQLMRAGYLTGDPETDRYIFHISNCDPPDHTRLRKLVQPAFTTRRVEGLRPRAEEIAGRLLDAADPTGPTDLVDAYAWPLAMTITAEFVGVPEADFDRYRTWATAMLVPPGTPDATVSRAEAYRCTRQFMADLIAMRRRDIGGSDAGDLLSALIVASDGGDRLTAEEMVALVIFMLNTGQEPTVNLIGNAVRALLDSPAQLRLLADRPDLLAGAIDEFLRFDAPVASSSLRIATTDIPTGDTVIPAGAVVSILFGAANRDPARHADPDRLDVTRPDASHLAFGHGIHRCVGAPLGRMVAEVGIATLLARHPRMRLDCAPEDLRWRPTRVTRGLQRLPVVLDPHPPADTRR